MIDINKKYRTRDGRKVRIYAVDGGWLNYAIHGAVSSSQGWEPEWWLDDGRKSKLGGTDPLDLIEVKPEVKGWINIYRAGKFLPENVSNVHPTKEIADQSAASEGRIACIPVTFTEGEGLETKDC